MSVSFGSIIEQIENVLRRYIVEYVTCKTCKSPDTTLTKDNRLFFMTCSSCGSTRSVQAIKTGFQVCLFFSLSEKQRERETNDEVCVCVF